MKKILCLSLFAFVFSLAPLAHSATVASAHSRVRAVVHHKTLKAKKHKKHKKHHARKH
jgi:hypothetical protein